MDVVGANKGMGTVHFLIWVDPLPGMSPSLIWQLGVTVCPKKGMGMVHFPCYIPGSRRWGGSGDIGDSRTRYSKWSKKAW